MARKISNVEIAGSDLIVTVEVENAYTDGRSRYDEYRIPSPGDEPTKAEIVQALRDADALRRASRKARASDVDTEDIATKAALEVKIRRLDERWSAWRRWREAAQEYGEPAGIVNALTGKETETWDRLKATLIKWNAAP